jgi:hypothetical protein
MAWSTHLQQIPIEIDKVAETWAQQAQALFSQDPRVPPTLQICSAEGQAQILDAQYKAITKVFPPSVCLDQYQHIYRL